MAIAVLAGHAEQVLPRLIVVVAVTATLLLRPQLFYNFERSPLAWVVAAGIVVISAVVRRVVARRSVTAAPWAAAVMTLTLFAVVAAPSFRSRTLNEDFPAVAAPVAEVVADLPSPSASPSSSDAPSASPSSSDAPSATPSPAAASSSPTAPTVSPTPRVTATVAAPVQTAPAVRPSTAGPKPSPTATAASGATLLSAGQFEGLAGHSASGRAALYRVGNGTVLRFEDVDISGAAKPSVHLVPPGKHRPEGGVSLGPLKAERGTFSYEVPASVNVNATWTVLVWCAPYDVPIAAADLQ